MHHHRTAKTPGSPSLCWRSNLARWLVTQSASRQPIAVSGSSCMARRFQPFIYPPTHSPCSDSAPTTSSSCDRRRCRWSRRRQTRCVALRQSLPCRADFATSAAASQALPEQHDATPAVALVAPGLFSLRLSRVRPRLLACWGCLFPSPLLR
jgi:hypothetical protein